MDIARLSSQQMHAYTFSARTEQSRPRAHMAICSDQAIIDAACRVRTGWLFPHPSLTVCVSGTTLVEARWCATLHHLSCLTSDMSHPVVVVSTLCHLGHLASPNRCLALVTWIHSMSGSHSPSHFLQIDDFESPVRHMVLVR